MKPPLVIAGFCREKSGGFSVGADRPPVERDRVFYFRLYNVEIKNNLKKIKNFRKPIDNSKKPNYNIITTGQQTI